MDAPKVARSAWLIAVRAHARAAGAHESTAVLFDRVGDPGLAQKERDCAVRARESLEAALAAHPEWAADARRVLGADLGSDRPD
jgi:hypothetical protein